MKKTLQFALITLIFTMLSGLSTAQWTMMDGSTLFEDAALGWVKVQTTTGVSDGEQSTYYTVVDDPDIEGNKLIKLDKRTTDTKEAWGIDWQVSNDDNALTFVLRMKPTAEILEYATTATTDVRLMWMQFRTGAFRDTWNAYLPNLISSEQSQADLTHDFSEWTIFRWVMKRDSSFLYINENPDPVFAGVSDMAEEIHQLMFGARTNLPAGAYYDWMVWNLEGGYAPGQGPALPATLTGLPGDPSSSKSLSLGDNVEIFPNPTFGQTTINYFVSQAQHTQIDLFDITGRLVINLVDQTIASGQHQVHIDAATLHPGIYFCRFQSGKTLEIKRLIRR